ncbi:ABC transporter substrate-binding protein [bacterium]|nr:ABC transporter substrate-binding protein [bacterium]
MQKAPYQVHLPLLLFLLTVSCGGGTDSSADAHADSDDNLVPRITVLSNVQAADPVEFESTRFMVELMRQLGLDVVHRALPWEQQADLVWYSRDKWQMTAWRMVGRPERLDPDEFVVNLFHSSNAESGYNFVGYNNPDYDALALEQRALVDRDERRRAIHAAQWLIAQDLPYLYLVHPKRVVAYRTDVFRDGTIVEMQGIGIHNFWTWTGVEPSGSSRDFVINTPDVIQAINPLYISGDADSRITEIIWDRLLRVGPDGTLRPWVAESVEWMDERTAVIRIRTDVRWHDGKPLTVDDVIFSFQVPAGTEAPMYKPFVEKIDDITKLDENKIRVTLKEPWVAFETAALAKINLIPKHIWEPVIQDLSHTPDNAEQFQEQTPIGSGPFRFVAWKPTEEVILAANRDHFAAPKMERWILRIIPNVESALGQLRSGEINFLMEWDGDATVLQQAADSDEHIEVVATTELGFRLFALNTRLEPLDDPVLRKSLAHIVPRTAIVTNIFKGFAEPADSYISPAIQFWHHPSLPKYEFGVEKAKEVLRKAGYRWNQRGRLLRPHPQADYQTAKAVYR